MLKIILFLISLNTFAAESFSYAYMQKSCAPHDGPSISIVFLEKKLKCNKLKGIFPKVSINWWDKIPKIPLKNQSFIFNKQEGAGFSFCPFKNKCEQPVQFGIHFEEVDKTKGKGDFILRRKNKVIIKSKFKLIVCPDSKVLCG